MKTALKIITLTLLVSSLGLVGCSETTTSEPKEIAEAPNTQAELLPISLPETALVLQKSNGSKSGQLTALSEQELTISQKDTSQTLSLSEVKRIVFQGDAWIRDEQGKRVRKFRGENASKKGEQVWREIPIKAFQLQNPETGSLSLGTVLSDENLQDILSISQDSVYIVDAIEFDSSGRTMTIKATPIDR